MTDTNQGTNAGGRGCGCLERRTPGRVAEDRNYLPTQVGADARPDAHGRRD